MHLANRIISMLRQLDQPSDFQLYRDILKSNTKLPAYEWASLCKLVKTNKVYNILRMNLSSREAEILGNALKKMSLNKVDDMIDILIKTNHKSSSILLKYIIEKKKKIDIRPIQNYLEEQITQGDAKFRMLKVIFALLKNYPNSITPKILDFCHTTDHPICREILESAMDVIE
ncbi:hypothetical protein CWI40_021650 [Ordospora colligata]|nr:hypothetical protein CWI40_021650 [Ordospora colligata]